MTPVPSPRMAKSTSMSVLEQEREMHIVDQDDIIGLTQDVKNFSDGLARLKGLFIEQCGNYLLYIFYIVYHFLFFCFRECILVCVCMHVGCAGIKIHTIRTACTDALSVCYVFRGNWWSLLVEEIRI